MGVAGRILLASSMLLLGVVVIITTLLYIYFANEHSRQQEQKVKAAAEAVATTPDLHTLGWGRLSGTLSEFKRLYELDTLTSVPLTDLQTGRLNVVPAVPGRDDRGETGGTQLPAGEDVNELPTYPADVVDRVADGEITTVFMRDSEGGTLYTLAPIQPTPEGLRPAVVIAGIHQATVRDTFQSQGNLLIAGGSVTFLLGSAGIWLTSRGLKRVTGDYGTQELSQIISYYKSVLQAVNDGLLLVNRKHGVVLFNEPAAELLGLPRSDTSIDFMDLPVPEPLRQLIESGEYVRDKILYSHSRVLLVNQQPARDREDAQLGTGDASEDTWVTTLKDHTELRQLTGELVSIKSFSDSLRSQTHEFANRMHIIASLIETGNTDKALEFATAEGAHTSADPEDLLGGFEQPVLAALVFTKLAQAKEDNIDLFVDASELESAIPGDERDLVTVLGNLLDNAFDAVNRPGLPPERKRVELMMSGTKADGFLLTVADDGFGIPEDNLDSIFERGWSTKHDGVEHDAGVGSHCDDSRGVGLDVVVQAVTRLGGAIDVEGGGDYTGYDAPVVATAQGSNMNADEPDLDVDVEPGENHNLRGAVFTVWLPGTSR